MIIGNQKNLLHGFIIQGYRFSAQYKCFSLEGYGSCTFFLLLDQIKWYFKITYGLK